MSLLNKLFGGTKGKPEAEIQQLPVNCDLCTGDVLPGNGYAFYSGTQQLPGMVTGNMLICQSCADSIMTDNYWEEIGRDVLAGKFNGIQTSSATIDQRRRCEHVGIIDKCLQKGLGPKRSKDRARELAQVWWKDRTRGMAETARFWNAS